MSLQAWKSVMGMKDIELDEAKQILKDAPWEQFQSTQADGFEDVKSLQQQKRTKLKRFIGKIKDADVSKETD